jgi:hypothetical protein
MLTGNPDAGDFSLKILDFGIARMLDSGAQPVTTQTTTAGSFLYMAPEQTTAADTVGPPADIYSVSAIFYELLLGVPATGRLEELTAQRSDLPPGIDALIGKGLNSRPRSRYQSAQEYMRALADIRLPGESPAVDKNDAEPVRIGPGAAVPGRNQSPEHRVAGTIPQIIHRKGKLRSESLLETDAPADAAYQSTLQTFEACRMTHITGNPLSRMAQATMASGGPFFSRQLTAKVEEASNASMVSIVHQGSGLGMLGCTKSKAAVHSTGKMLTQQLSDGGWNAAITRELYSTPRMWPWVLAAVFLILAAASALNMSGISLFGPTNAEIIQQYKGQYAQLRTDLREIAQSLPDFKVDQEPSQPLQPPPDYREAGGEGVNTDFLMYEHLVNPEANLSMGEHLDLYLARSLKSCLLWTGPQNPMVESALRERATLLSTELEAGLRLKYLGIIKILQYEPPVASSETKFVAGKTLIAGYLVELRTRQIPCMFHVSAETAGQVEVTTEKGEDPKTAVERWARSSLFTASEQRIIEAAQRTCGGTFVLRK